MPEAVKEGGVAAEVAGPPPEHTVPPPHVDLATDGVIEVKPPPDTEPSLPADHNVDQKVDADEKMGETAPDVKEPPTVADKTDSSLPTEALNETKAAEVSSKEELDEMILKGRGLLTIKRDCYAAAEVLSKACEISSNIYGELSEHCGELYYLYGCSMLECGKTENNVLGEGMKSKESEEEAAEEDEDEAGDEDDTQEEKSEPMEVDESEEGATSSVDGTSNGAVIKDDKEEGDDTTKDEEEEDSSLKVAWEMFELAKVAFCRTDNKEKLADTFMKLGEVGIESGHPAAMEDMLKALDIRQQLHPNSRIIAETHFNVGLGYSMFEMFDEAVTHFDKSKSLLEEITVNLENAGDDNSLKEAKEIRDVLPDLKDKIQDMLDSKRDKRKEMEETINSNILAAAKQNGTVPAGSSSESDKPASNISHLIKRKRKIDEVTSDLPTKTAEEPKRKVKAMEKEATEEQLGEAAEDQNKNNDQLVSNQGEPMEMEVVKNIECTKDSSASNSQSATSQELKATVEKDDLESVRITNSMDCESTQSGEKEVPVNKECKETSEKLTTNEEKNVDSFKLEVEEMTTESTETTKEISNPDCTEENSKSSSLDIAAVQDVAKETLTQEECKKAEELLVEKNSTTEKSLVECTDKDAENTKSFDDVKLTSPEPAISKESSIKESSELEETKESTIANESSLKDNSESETANAAEKPAGNEKKNESTEPQKDAEKTDLETTGNEVNSQKINTHISNESEQMEESEVVNTPSTEMENCAATPDKTTVPDKEIEGKIEVEIKTETTHVELEGEEVHKKTTEDLGELEKREMTESSEKINPDMQPGSDSMDVQSTTKDTGKSTESEEMETETNASEIEQEKPLETVVSSSAQENMETTDLTSSRKETVDESKVTDESEMESVRETADSKSNLPSKETDETLNEPKDRPSELKELEVPMKTDENSVEQQVTETSEGKELENASIKSDAETSNSKSDVNEESQNLSTATSKSILEQKSVTNGCKESSPVDEDKTNIEAPVVAKELGKEEITATVAAE